MKVALNQIFGVNFFERFADQNASVIDKGDNFANIAAPTGDQDG